MGDLVKIEGQGLVEPSSGDGTGETEATVWVVNHIGDLVEAGDYLLGAVWKGRGEASLVGEKGSSQQVDGPVKRAHRWAAPRVAMRDLLLFYDFNVWHRRCVLLKALLVGGLGWQLVEGTNVIYDPRQHSAVPDDEAARLLARPNESPLETFDELVFRFLVDYYSQGNSYFEVVRDRKGRPARLYHAPARTMRRDARFRGYWQVKATMQQRFATFGAEEQGSRNEILHLYSYDPLADYYGVPDWLAALATMGLDRVILEYNLRLFANSLMAHLAIVVEGGRLSKEGREAVKQFVQERMVGVKNAGRILLLEDENDRVKVRFEKLNLEVKDLMTTKPQEHFRDVVVSAHGVPPRLLGIVAAGQLGGTGEIAGQLQIFRETVLRPAKSRLETVLSALLEEVRPGVRVRFYEMDITDAKADAEFFDKMIERGVYKPEEAREMLDRLRA